MSATIRPIRSRATVAAPKTSLAGKPNALPKGSDISADWWTLFHSEPLNELIEQSLANNHDLKAAQAALSVARENVLAQRGVYYPSVAASFSASRQRQSGQIAPDAQLKRLSLQSFHPAGQRFVRARCFRPEPPDRGVIAGAGTGRAFSDDRDVHHLDRQCGGHGDSGGLVADADRRDPPAHRQQLQHASRSCNTNLPKAMPAGSMSPRRNRSSRRSSATLPPLLKQLAQLRDLLAVLAGRFPSQAPAENFELSSLQLPQDLPVSLPSALVAQRPDVLQAEANLHDASAKIGIAIANRLPNIVLTANAGSTAAAMNQLFTSGTGFWGVGATATAPIFQGGTLLHQERAAKAAYVQAAEQYRSTVLTAFQNVADTLTALEQDAEALKAAAAAADAAKVTLDLAQRQWQDGYAGYLALLSAEQAYQQSQINLVQAQANRYADTAALFQALGGGWWHRADLAKDKHEK